MKHLFKLGLSLLIVLFLCINNYGQTKKSPLKGSCKKSILLQTFKDIPKEIDGGGCYFFLSKKDKKEVNYVCVNDFANLAFVKLNGRIEKFELVDHKVNSSFYFYKNKNYELKIEITKKEFGEYESSNIEGIITIRTKEGLKLERFFIGFCGC